MRPVTNDVANGGRVDIVSRISFIYGAEGTNRFRKIGMRETITNIVVTAEGHIMDILPLKEVQNNVHASLYKRVLILIKNIDGEI